MTRTTNSYAGERQRPDGRWELVAVATSPTACRRDLKANMGTMPDVPTRVRKLAACETISLGAAYHLRRV